MSTTSTKSRAATLLLALFLGGAGAHRFYVGKTGSAVVMLLLTITIVGILVTFFWAWVDIIRIAAGGFKDKEGATITNW